MKAWLAALVPLALCGCGSETPNAGGGGFGGETLSGMVVDSSGDPIAGARIRLHRSASLDAVPLQESVTDARGGFLFAAPGSGAFRIAVAGLSGTDSVKALVDLEPGTDAGTIVASIPSRRSIRLVTPSGSPVRCRLQVYGSGATLESDDSGTIDASSLPASDLWAHAVVASGQELSDVFIPHDARGDLVVDAGWTIDGFEQSENKTRLGLLVGGGWWYVVSHGIDSADSAALSPSALRDTALPRTGTAALHAAFRIGSQLPAYGLVGFHFGPTRLDAVDLSGMDSLVFWARGSGSVRVEFVADTGGGVTSHAITIALQPAWTRVALRPAELLPIDSGRVWSVDRKRVRFLQFISFATVDLHLDDLRYYGSAPP